MAAGDGLSEGPMRRGSTTISQGLQAFWSIPAPEVLQRLQTTPDGLTSAEARQRLVRHGPNLLERKKRSDDIALLLGQFKNPIALILLGAAALSFFLHDPTDAVIILAIILVSALLGFWQERGAARAIEQLLALIQLKTTVVRDGQAQSVPVDAVVPGDVLTLSAGGNVPADCLLLEVNGLQVDEAALTGESYPAEKAVAVLPAETPLGQRTNTLFLGTHVVSGTAKAVVVGTGKQTEFGKLAERLQRRPPETEFERGVTRFGYFLLTVTLSLVLAILAVNLSLGRPVLTSVLFSLALAVGLTPQLLPAIVSVTLAHGARRMARQKVIVRRLAAIENLGSMNILCADKTGTLTEGSLRLHAALDVAGNESEKVLFHAYLNARYEAGFANPIDKAIRGHREFDVTGYEKLAELPYDFTRKRLTVLIAKGDRHFLVTKGALANVLDACASAEADGERTADITALQPQIQAHLEEFSRQGLRTLGVAYRDVGSAARVSRDDEAAMTFLGFLVFSDPLKAGIAETIRELERLGISLKIITGDNRLIAAAIGQQIGLPEPRVLTGSDLRDVGDEALRDRVMEANVLAEIEPTQKERIILALKHAGNVVGCLGDGINDAPALHAADVGVSVEGAVDVAKEAAAFVLLEKDLGVLAQGVREGRMTFANTLKYVFMATSANFGNMLSMAGASLFLPYLPLLPKQILLTNVLTDCPEMTIATDRVDPELTDRPRRWDVRFIATFMLTFGSLSSVFDVLTFVALLLVLHATPGQLRTGWFLESVVSAALIVLVIRSRRPLFKSRPGRSLLLATLLIGALTVLFPVTPLARVFEFEPLPLGFLGMVASIVAAYIAAAEVVKRVFYAKVKF
jgi:Mg2+-importing ATPase